MMNAIGIVKKMRPGDDVDAQCGKCKDVRTHAIIAVNEQGKIERVQCRTCQGTHNYKNPVKETKRASGTGSTGTRASGAGRSGAAAVPTGPTRQYSPRDSFQTGDQISHPTFGLGYVSDVRDKKIDVKFGRETKTLIHAG